MKAVCIRDHGELERVGIEDVPRPDLAAGEALVAVRAAALNHLDIWVRKGRPGLALEWPHVLGSDASGVVVEADQGAHGIERGEEVILNPGLNCGCCEFCLRGQQSECPQFGIVGMTRPGTFAEYVAVPAASVWPKPAHLSFEEAAALPLDHLTAWRMLMTRAELRAGETILIHGIGGGVALAALQLARISGARAIVTSSSDEKLKRAIQLGASHAVNYRRTDDVAQAVREFTSGRGVDVALDTAGAATWPIDFAAVRRGGRIVICGVTTGASAQTNLQALYWNQLTILGSTMGSQDEFRQMLQAVSAAQLRPVVDSILPLDRAREAMGRMEAGAQFGKIVLAMR